MAARKQGGSDGLGPFLDEEGMKNERRPQEPGLLRGLGGGSAALS